METSNNISAPTRVVDFLLVLLLWGAYSRLVILFWGFLAVHNPVHNWMLNTLIADYRDWYYPLIYTHDAIINALLLLPLAYLLLKIWKRNLWVALVASAIVIFLWDYRQVLFGEGDPIDFFSYFGAIWGALVSIALFPLIYSGLRKITVRKVI